MTCSSIKIIYLTILWTLTCPLLHCFSLLNPNYIVLLTSIQTLQTASLTLSVPEENYDKITKALKKNPSLLNKLIEQAKNPKPQIQLVPQGGRLTNGLSSFLSRPFSGLPTVNNPVAVALPTETMIGGQKFVLSNRASLYGHLLRKLGSTIVSPVTKSFNYFKNLGETQEITKNALKFISNKFKNNDGNKSEEEEEEEEEEERPKKSKKKNAKKDKKKKSSISDEDDASSDEDEKPKGKQKKGANKKNNKNKNKSPEKSSEEKDSNEDNKSSDEEEENPGKKKDPKKKKNDGGNSKSDDDKSGDSDDDKSGDTDNDNSGDTDDDKSDDTDDDNSGDADDDKRNTDNSGSSSQ